MKKSLYFILCFAFFNVLHATDEEIEDFNFYQKKNHSYFLSRAPPQ